MKIDVNKMIDRSVQSVKDVASSVSEKYDNTRFSPFPKIPENITIKVDIAGSYADLLEKAENLDEEKVERIVKALTKIGTIFERVIEDKFDRKSKK